MNLLIEKSDFKSKVGVKHKTNLQIQWHFVKKNQEKKSKNQKNQLKSQEQIKDKKNLVRLFFKCFTPRKQPCRVWILYNFVKLLNSDNYTFLFYKQSQFWAQGWVA